MRTGESKVAGGCGLHCVTGRRLRGDCFCVPCFLSFSQAMKQYNPQLNHLKTPSQTQAEVCLLGDSRSHTVDTITSFTHYLNFTNPILLTYFIIYTSARLLCLEKHFTMSSAPVCVVTCVVLCFEMEFDNLVHVGFELLDSKTSSSLASKVPGSPSVT